jgi:hypothetical protein
VSDKTTTLGHLFLFFSGADNCYYDCFLRVLERQLAPLFAAAKIDFKTRNCGHNGGYNSLEQMTCAGSMGGIDTADLSIVHFPFVRGSFPPPPRPPTHAPDTDTHTHTHTHTHTYTHPTHTPDTSPTTTPPTTLPTHTHTPDTHTRHPTHSPTATLAYSIICVFVDFLLFFTHFIALFSCRI